MKIHWDGLWTTISTRKIWLLVCLFVCLYGLNHIQLQWIYKTIDVYQYFTYSHKLVMRMRERMRFFSISAVVRRWSHHFHQVSLDLSYTYIYIFLIVIPSYSFIHAFILHLHFNWCWARDLLLKILWSHRWSGVDAEQEKERASEKNKTHVTYVRFVCPCAHAHAHASVHTV